MMDDEQTVRSALPAVMAQTLLQPAATRGAAATHDLNRLNLLINLHGHASGLAALSYFDQAAVERTEIVHGRQVGALAQRIWLKGCYTGVTSQSEDALWTPVHSTEAARLPKRLNRHHPETTPSTLTRNDVAPCVSRYQRLTTPALSTVPDQADVVWEPKGDRFDKSLRPTRVAV
jgi:hypothetical protein